MRKNSKGQYYCEDCKKWVNSRLKCLRRPFFHDNAALEANVWFKAMNIHLMTDAEAKEVKNEIDYLKTKIK